MTRTTRERNVDHTYKITEIVGTSPDGTIIVVSCGAQQALRTTADTEATAKIDFRISFIIVQIPVGFLVYHRNYLPFENTSSTL